MTRVVLCVQNMDVPDDPRVWNEATSLAGAGYDVTVVAPRSAGAPDSERIDGVDVIRYRTARERRGTVGQLLEAATGFVGTARLVMRIRKNGPIAVLHVANPPDTLFPLAWWLRRSGTCFVFDQHDPTPELLAAKLGRRPLLDRVLRSLERRTYAAADLVIACNNSRRQLAIDRGGLAAERVVTIRLGPRAAEPPVEPPVIPTAVYAGVMGSQDTVEVLIDAFAEVLRRRPGAARLVLIGTGDAVDQLHRRVTEHGIDDAVTWTGWLARDQMRRRVSMATVGVSPDIDDSYTRTSTMIKVSEYLSLGLPAIVADLPENRATAGDAAAYFRAGDVGELAERLSEILFDPRRREEMAAAASRRAPSLLWAHSEPRLLDSYRYLLEGGPALDGEQHVADALVGTGG
jgi:glycosyltransferase involved in cell wall biosynthesis